MSLRLTLDYIMCLYYAHTRGCVMRITVHVPENIGKEVRRLAENEKKSVSSVVARSIEFFIDETRRRQARDEGFEACGENKGCGRYLRRAPPRASRS